MRNTLLALVLLLSACATTGGSPSNAQIANAIREKIQNGWMLPPGDGTIGRVSASISLNENGTLGSTRITHSSGDKVADNALLRAIRIAMPLPIPADKIADFREIELTFNPEQ